MGLETDPVVTPETQPGWTLAQRVVFRFICIYLVIFIFPFPIDTVVLLITNLREIATGEEADPAQPSLVTQYMTKPYRDFWDEVVVWTSQQVFGVEIQYRPANSGDTTWNYVQIFDFAVIAVALTLLWSLAAWVGGRRRGPSRRDYACLHEWLRVYVRFFLAWLMILYGALKVIKLQFRELPPDTWLHTYGESSPMHMLWTFMGASDEYTWFTGAGEVLAGLLLCFRRTTLLGALVTFGVMVHVLALNLCFDVPVKLLSSHLVLMSVFLMAPDLPWLTKVFLLGQSVAPRAITPLVRWRWLDWTLIVVRTVVVFTYLGLTLYLNHETSKVRGLLVPEPPLYGLWEVEEFTLDGQVRPPLTTDAARWQYVSFRKPYSTQRSKPGTPSVLIMNMPGKVVLYADVAADEEKKTITLSRPSRPPLPGTQAVPSSPTPPTGHLLTYREVEPGVIEVTGGVAYVADGKSELKQVKVRLRHYGKDKFLLLNRPFRWINETNYNMYGPHTEPAPKLPPPPPKRP